MSRVGAQRPTHLLTPEGRFDFTEGDIAIDLAASLGLVLLDWQKWLVRWILATDEAGRLACLTVILIVPRQNGKGAILECLELYWLIVAEVPKVFHTAHEADTAAEHMGRIEGLLADDDERDFELPLTHTFKSNGKERTMNLDPALRKKLVLQYRTRTKSTKRGSSPQRILFDECQELQDAHIAALVPSLAAQSMDESKLPQMIYTGSAPLEHSDYMHALLGKVQSEKPKRTLLAMWACDADVDPANVDMWYLSNPSLGILISEDWVRDTEYMVMSAEDFAAERLGVPKVKAGRGPAALNLARWATLTDPESIGAPGTERLALEIHGQNATFGIAGTRVDGLGHMSIRDAVPVGQLVDRAGELATGHGCPITIVKGSAADAYTDELIKAGVAVDVIPAIDGAKACTKLIQAVEGEALFRHRGDTRISTAIAAAVVRESEGGLKSFSRKGTDADISWLLAPTIAWSRVGVTVEEEFFVY